MTFDPIAYINEPRWRESRLGLDRIRDLLERLDRPQDRLKFVHVAGTNGKGSTCAYIASVLREAGYRTGLFTSPFIESFEERIRVDDQNISFDDLTCATLAVKEQTDAMEADTGDHPTEFELMTAVALVHFARCACEIVVLEVGLGGRLDSTNVIDAPEVCVIARIGLDHTALLGNTLAAIAGEKAGIIKNGVPVVSWPQDDDALPVIEDVAHACGSLLVTPDFDRLDSGSVIRGTGGDGSCPDGVNGDGACAKPGGLVRVFSYASYAGLKTQLVASYQPANAALAIEAIEILRGRGWDISDEALRKGIAHTRWPGRFEIIDGGPGLPTVVVDGGHNPQGARALVDSLGDLFPGRRPVFIIGVLEDKDYPEMLETVLPLGQAFIAVLPDNPRALSAEKLARAIRWTGQDLLGCSACLSPYVAPSMVDAVKKALELAGPDGLVCVFGSLYSIAALKGALAAIR